MWLIPLLAIIFGVVIVDQVSKLLVLHFLYKESITVIPGVLDFTYVENRGMAFGLLSDHRWVFMVLSTVGIALLSFYLFRFVKPWLGRIGLSLIIGGGIGNMIDRIAYGYVVDFIDFCLFDFWVWVFNIADAAVCVGAGIFILQLILEIVAESKKSHNGMKKSPQTGEKSTEEPESEKGDQDGTVL
ncbi:MAG: signal peptidase II [Clostridia bacterium]|nr:signal peptidase II [Clostridia bacterium]